MLLSVTYIPGWSSDLTHWTIEVYDSGVMKQVIEGDRRASGESKRVVEEMKEVSLGSTVLNQIKCLLSEISELEVESLDSLCCVDDAPCLSLRLPCWEKPILIAFPDTKRFWKNGKLRLENHEETKFKALEELWNTIDSHAVYSLKRHFNG